MAKLGERRDWSRLPPELLQEIASHLTEISDNIRFLCVCVSWRSASQTASSLPRQFPWLRLPVNNDGKNHCSGRFFSFTENRTYTLPTPRCFSCAGPLLLLNPLTRSTILLPPLPLMITGLYCIKLKLSGSGLVAALFYDGLIFFTRHRQGETSWKKIDPPPCFQANVDFTCHNGRFFVVYPNGAAIWVFDADQPSLQNVLKVLTPPTGCPISRQYLVETPSGELLLLLKKARYCKCNRFQLFRVNVSGEQVKWVEVSDTGDSVLFVDRVQAMAFAAGEFNGCRRNCIYFVDGNKERGEVQLFDIGKGRTERVPLLFSSCIGPKKWEKRARWVVPTLGSGGNLF